MRTSINITPQTSVQDLRTFLQDAQYDGNTKLRAKTRDDGTTVLYAKSSGTKLLERLTGRASEKKLEARHVIKDVLQRTPDLSLETMKMLDIAPMVQVTKSMRTDKLAALVDPLLLRADSNSDIGALDAPLRHVIGGHVDNFKQGLAQLAPNDQVGLTALKTTLTTDIVNTLTGVNQLNQLPNLSTAESEHLRTSDGKPFIREIAAMIGQDMPLDDRMALASDIFDTAIQQLETNSFSQNDGRATMTLGGRTFQKDTSGGWPKGGGFGDIWLYREQGGTETLIVKTPKYNPNTAGSREAAFEDFKGEARMHRRLEDAQANGVLPLEGVIRDGDDICIVQPVADGGSLFDLMGKIETFASQPNLSPQAAALVTDMRLTLLKDFLTGLDSFQQLGLGHQDIKSPNVLVMDGQAYVADFGQSLESATVIPDQRKVDNPAWLAPERLSAVSDNETQLSRMNQTNRSIARAFQTAVFGTTANLPAGLKAAGDTLKTNVMEGLKQSNFDDASRQRLSQYDAAASDLWGAGISGLELFFGRTDSPVDAFQFMSYYERALETYETGNVDALSPGGLYQTGRTTGDAQIDSLLNRMLHRDPSQRPDAATLLQDPVFQRPGVDQQVTRDAIRNL